MTLEKQIANFYSSIGFPGPYTLDDLNYYNNDDIYQNRFLKPYLNAAIGKSKILEIGCGSGYITNLIAHRNHYCKIDAVDFSDSIDYAINFSKQNNINNITYYKENFLTFTPKENYDLIISNGVLHHIPDYKLAIDKINNINANHMVLGIYNTYGKLLKKIVKINYRSKLLHQDQEQCPFEVSFTDKEFRSYFPNYVTNSICPGGDFKNLFNFNNGGLTVYHFEKIG